MGSASTRYWLAQIPGWILSGAILVGLWMWAGLPGWLAGLLLGLFVAKDVVFYPFAKRALEAPAQVGHESLVGRRGVVVDPLDPEGRVRIEGELWRAAVQPSAAPVAAGDEVRVARVRGLTLWVDRAPAD